jgi:hypothetical protein
MLRFYIAKIRGNATILATWFVSLATLVGGLYLNAGSSKDPISAALVAAAVASFIGSITSLLSESPLQQIPSAFKSGALHEFKQKRLYRHDSEITIELEGERLAFKMKSRIIKFADDATLAAPVVDKPLSDMTLEPLPSYKLDGQERGFTEKFPITKDMTEDLRVVYRCKNTERIWDKHTWNCPVDRFTLIVKMPIEYDVRVRDLVDIAILGSCDRDGTYRFSVDTAAFSHQGFIWEILKKTSASPAQIARKE